MDVHGIIKGTIEFMDNFWNIKTYGLERIAEGNGILAPNHADWKDTWVIEAKIPRTIYWVGNRDLVHPDMQKRVQLYWEFLKYGYEDAKGQMKFGIHEVMARILARIAVLAEKAKTYIPVDKNGTGVNLGMIKKVAEKLYEDHLVAWFPGGHIPTDRSIAPFKEGVALASHFHKMMQAGDEAKRDLPVYPVALKNTSLLFHPYQEVYMSVGDPLYLRDFGSGGRDKKRAFHEFTGTLESEVRRLHAALP